MFIEKLCEYSDVLKSKGLLPPDNYAYRGITVLIELKWIEILSLCTRTRSASTCLLTLCIIQFIVSLIKNSRAGTREFF